MLERDGLPGRRRRRGYAIAWPDGARLIRLAALAAAASLAAIMIRGCAIAARGADSAGEKGDAARGQTVRDGMTVLLYDERAGGTVSLPLEEYILRVTAAEMPASFSMEALKAQAVAARTYTVRRLEGCGGAPCGRGGGELCSSSSCCQAYRSREALGENWGENAEAYFKKLEEAVSATAGLILTHEGEPIEALFHSSSGGRTEDAAEVFGGDAPYLKGVPSPGEEAYAHYSSVSAFGRREFAAVLNAAYPKAALAHRKLEEQVEVRERSDSGRVLSIRLGNVNITGRELRKALELPSTAFTLSIGEEGVRISCKGYGHGVGMSQYGAEAMAADGADFAGILQHYYTGAEICSIDSLG